MRVGDIHWVELPNVGGREQAGRRPAIILQDDDYELALSRLKSYRKFATNILGCLVDNIGTKDRSISNCPFCSGQFAEKAYQIQMMSHGQT